MAATLAAAKLGIPVAHVEAGLRSFDRRMPEEVNRIVTDSLANLLLVSEPTGVEHLQKEGHPSEHIHLVGNVMIDTLRALLPKAQSGSILQDQQLTVGEYGVVTLHRPSNVDSPETLSQLIEVLVETSARLPLVFPVHPRTQARLENFDLLSRLGVHRADSATPPAGLSGLPGADLSITGHCDRFRRIAGGIDRSGHSLPDHAGKHRTPGHRQRRHQHPHRKRCREAPRGTQQSAQR